MGKRRLTAILLFFGSMLWLFTACQPLPETVIVDKPVLSVTRTLPNGFISEDSLISTSDAIDQVAVSKAKSLIVNSDSLLEAGNDQIKICFQFNREHWEKKMVTETWPSAYQYLYTVVKQNGRVLSISVIPYSEHGKFFLRYVHYFDENGTTIAFRRESNFYGSLCHDKVAFETSLYVYLAGKLIFKDYWVKNSKGELLNPWLCKFPYHYDYQIYSSLKESPLSEILSNINSL